MKVHPLALSGVLLIEPDVLRDERGSFQEVWQQGRYEEAGIIGPFVQDNVSRSTLGTLRGLHIQEPHPQGKLVQALAGAVFDVAVDLRRGSPTFGEWLSATLTAENGHQLWVPPGFAHGYCVVSAEATVVYKCTDIYRPRAEHVIAWNDPTLAVRWPIEVPRLSRRDAAAPSLKQWSETFRPSAT